MNLIRSIFPHWNFFDRVGSSFSLEYQLQGAPQWRRVSFAGQRTLMSLFVNTDLNESLAQYSLIEQFVQDGSETTYKMICALLRVKVGSGPMKFQVVALAEERHIVFESEWIHA